MKGQILFVFGSQACVPDDGLVAARQLGYETIVFGAKVMCGMSQDLVDRFERVDLTQIDRVIGLARRVHAVEPVHGVVAYDDQAVPVAARVAEALGLPGHPVAAADAARDKVLMKHRFLAAGIPIAPLGLAKDEEDAVRWAAQNGYPVVVKPVRGSASQGVIRADDEEALRRAYRRLRRIVREYGLDCGDGSDSEQLVEGYIDGDEFSVELLVKRGVPHVLCVFEKPLPLTGPFFEETIYVTPPRLEAVRRRAIEELAVQGVAALGLRDGAAHCEVRFEGERGFVLEIGARLIGGACSRVFRHVLGEDIHPYVLRVALGEDVELPQQARGAAGAMMIPIPEEGRLRSMEGWAEARAVEGIEDAIVNTSPGEAILPFPEQSCYVGFLTAHGETVEQVESALSEASGRIRLVLDPLGCERWDRTIEDQRSYSPPSEYGIRTLAGYEMRQAEEEVLPLVAASHYGELPEDAGLAAARECLGCLDGSGGGEVSPDYWLVAQGRGFALSWVEGGIGFLSLLGVVSDQRRSGIGEALVRSAMGLFAQRGCTRMEVSVNPRQPGSMAFYRSLGFTAAECHEHECCSC